MSPLDHFLSSENVSLKICGVTTETDAEALVALAVPALGVNFWHGSKRYLRADDATWLHRLAGKILRIGVFVNEPPDLPIRLFHHGLIDAIQLHGDETPEDTVPFHQARIPFIKAIGTRTKADLERAADYRANAILLDAHAPGIYGGTGELFDWNIAIAFKKQHPRIPLILAGGILPENTALAASTVQPAAIDVASGAESAPGIKDFQKVAAYLQQLDRGLQSAP